MPAKHLPGPGPQSLSNSVALLEPDVKQPEGQAGSLGFAPPPKSSLDTGKLPTAKAPCPEGESRRAGLPRDALRTRGGDGRARAGRWGAEEQLLSGEVRVETPATPSNQAAALGASGREPGGPERACLCKAARLARAWRLWF